MGLASLLGLSAPSARKKSKKSKRVLKLKLSVKKPEKKTKPKKKKVYDTFGFLAGSSPNDTGFLMPPKSELNRIWNGWTAAERKLLQKLDTPSKIQDFLDSMGYDPKDGCRSVRTTLKTRKAHCLGGATLAYYLMTKLGYKCTLIGFGAVNDDGHAICVFRQPSSGVPGKFLYGSISKSNYTGLRSRDCVFSSIRELVMSYYNFHFNVPMGEKSVLEWNGPFNGWLHTDEDFEKVMEQYESEDRKLDHLQNGPLVSRYRWLFSDNDCEEFETGFDYAHCYPILPKKDDIRKEGKRQPTEGKRGLVMMLANETLKKAGQLGGNPDGYTKVVYKE